MKKKWLYELKNGEVFTTTENPKGLEQYYIALDIIKSKTNIICSRICQPLFEEKISYLFLKNMMVYTCGIKFKNI